MFQLLVQNYVPSKEYGETLVDWTKLNSDLNFDTPVLASATRALSMALIARSTGNKQTSHLSMKPYGDALSQLREASTGSGLIGNPSELLKASLFMSLYEIFEVPVKERSGWLVHRQGMVPLLKRCQLKPDMSEVDLEIMKTVRVNLVISGLVCRKNLVPPDLVLVGPTWETPMQSLIGVLAELPPLLESLDQTASLINGLEETTAIALLSKQLDLATHIARELDSWSALYAIDLEHDGTNESFAADTPFLCAQSMLLHWTGELYISAILNNIMLHCSSEQSPHLDNIDIDAYVAARRIVLTAPYLLSPGTGFVGRNAITLPLVVAMEYFRGMQMTEVDQFAQESGSQMIQRTQVLFGQMDLRGLPM